MKNTHFKIIRVRLGLTQTELGDKLKQMTGKGSRQLVAKIEGGKTPIKDHIEAAMIKLDKEK